MSVTLSSATLSAVSGVSNDLHAICEQVYNEPHTEPQTVGLTSLTQPQRKAILELLKRIDLSNPVQRKNLIVEIKENPRVTRIVHLAITSSDGLGNDYQAFDQALTQSILDKLEVVANIGVSNIRANAIDEWLSQYHSHFDQKTLKVLETKDLYRLTSRLVQCECPNLPAYKALFQNLPEAGKSYAALLKLPISAFWKKTCEVHSGPSQRSYQNRYTALAYYIACKKLSMSRVEKLLTEKELFELMPYLRYGNFEGMQGDTVEKLFASVADLQDLQLQDVTISDLNITQLPALPACQTLYCFNCPQLRALPDVLPLCHTFDCSECAQLQALPVLPACQALYCSNCPQLQELPTLPACQTLRCFSCPRLQALPDVLPLCHTLDCSECPQLQALPALPLCQILDCSKCIRLQALPALPLCRILDCSRCIQLKLLPALFLCETLNCHKCSNLQALPALPLCQTLTCYKCLELRIVPDVLPLCETLDCSECPQLQALPALPLCQALDCSDCTQLQALLDLPTCQTLDCSRCTQLQTPPTDLPVCLEFWCEECPFLGTRIPRLPQDAQVYTGSGDSMRLEVEINQLDSHPKVVLLELGRNYLLQDKTFPEVYYREDDQENTQEDGGRLLEAIDEGGVRRDLVSRLITSLFDQRRPSADRLSLDLEGFPLLTDPQDIDCFRTLGRILALCYPSDSSFKTGELFPAEFYKKIALTPWSNNIADEDLISNYLHFRELHVISQVADLTVGLSSVDNKALESAAYFLTIDPDENEPRTFFTDPGNRALLRNTIIENARDDKRFSAAALIAQEMKSALGAQAWDQLCSEEKMNEGALLRTRIEGQLSASKLLLQLQYLSQGTVTPLLKEKTSRYLNTWVEKASEEELLQFVRAVTSNNALGKDPINVEIYMRGPEYIPVAHTCSFTIELSGEYPNQETFDKKIKWLLEEGMEKGGFQNA